MDVSGPARIYGPRPIKARDKAEQGKRKNQSRRKKPSLLETKGRKVDIKI